MRKGNKKRTLSQITLIILGICIILISNIETHASYNNPAQNQEINIEIKAAILLNPHEPIRIDGNVELDAFCAGNGTDGLSWETAFKIENYSITSGKDSGISIKNTDRFLIIKNCSIENFDSYWATPNGTYYEKGIEIKECSNVKITMCSLTENRYGVYLDSSFNNFIIQNNCSYNDWGLTLVNSEYTTIFNNTAFHSGEIGINLIGCNQNNISTNFVRYNWNGIGLTHNYDNYNSEECQENLIVNNKIENNFHDGISLSSTERNSVINNDIFNNKGTGIMLSYSSDNILSFNSIHENDNQGISLSSQCDWNVIMNNDINDNTNGIIISYSGYNTIAENTISNHYQGSGILINYDEEYQLEQNIYENIFENNWQNISYDQFDSNGSSISPYYLYFGIPIVIIGILAIIIIIYRKKTRYHGIDFIYEPEIKKGELKSPNDVLEKVKRKDSKSSFPVINYLLNVIGWMFILDIMVLFIILSFDLIPTNYEEPYYLIDIPILIILLIINRKNISERWEKFISEREIKRNELWEDKMIRAQDISSRSSNSFVENMNRKDSKLIYKILKVIFWFFMIILFIGLSIITYFLFDILVIIICIIYRKKIKYRWKKFISDREIKKGELKIDRAKRTKEIDSKSFLHVLNKILKFIFWSVAFFTIFLGIGASIAELSLYFLIEIPILIIISLSFVNRKKIKYFYQALRSNFLINIGQIGIEKAIKYARMHNYKGSRSNWLSSERNFTRALRIIPDFHKIDFLENQIIVIKQNILASYLSEGIFLSKVGWFRFQKKQYSQAKKKYSKSISAIEHVLKNINTENVINTQDEFPINTSLTFEILQFLRKSLDQIEIEEKTKKKSKNNTKSRDLQEIDEKIVYSIKEINESLWIYCQSLDSHIELLDLDGLSKILENKLTKSEKILNSIQDQMQYLVDNTQTPIKKYERNNVEKKSDAMNISSTLDQERTVKKHLKIIREYEYIGGKIRLKVGIVNHSDNVLTNLAIRFDLPDSLKWIIHEPNLKRRGDTIHIARLGGNEKIAISLYLEPINCLESMINATITYFDSKDQPQAAIMTPKKVSISCPIFFTREEANIARVKKIQLQLKYEDHKIFPLVKSNKSELIFNKILGSIGKHDVKLVQKEFSLDNNKGEAYFYGVTKVKKDKMIIHLILDSTHQIIEISVNGDEQEPITGLLAELESEIRDQLLVHNIIEDSDKFHDINTSILLGNCPFCNGPISQSSISFFKKGEIITCKYCDTALTPY